MASEPAAAALKRDPANVFINVPFDPAYEKLFTAMVTAVVALGREPHCALEVPDGGEGRLERIVELIKICPASLHDVSRQSGRHNMAFELGFACGAKHFGASPHAFFVFEARRFRLQRTLSDLNIVDPYVHERKLDGIFQGVLSCLSTGADDPTVRDLRAIYAAVRSVLPVLLREHKAKSVFNRPMFKALVGLALAARDEFKSA